MSLPLAAADRVASAASFRSMKSVKSSKSVKSVTWKEELVEQPSTDDSVTATSPNGSNNNNDSNNNIQSSLSTASLQSTSTSPRPEIVVQQDSHEHLEGDMDSISISNSQHDPPNEGEDGDGNGEPEEAVEGQGEKDNQESGPPAPPPGGTIALRAAQKTAVDATRKAENPSLKPDLGIPAPTPLEELLAGLSDPLGLEGAVAGGSASRGNGSSPYSKALNAMKDSGEATGGPQPIPSLVAIALYTVIGQVLPEAPSQLDTLPPALKSKVISQITLSDPIALSAMYVTDEAFWKTACTSKWRNCSPGTGQAPSTWKALYMQMRASDELELAATASDTADAVVFLKAASPYIKRLKLSQVLSRYDMGAILAHLPSLEELSLTFSVRKLGMDFAWGKIGASLEDVVRLANGLRAGAAPALTCLALPECSLDDEKVRALAAGLLHVSSLKTLDLSHNRIGDRGARGIAQLLGEKSKHRLTALIVADNNIHEVGAKAIGKAVGGSHSQLQVLSLRLNRLGNGGVEALVSGLLGGNGGVGSLRQLNLAGNSLGPSSATAIARLLVSPFSHLAHLDVTGNQLGDEGGSVLQEALASVPSAVAGLNSLDVRANKMRPVAELALAQVVAGQVASSMLPTGGVGLGAGAPTA